MKSKGFTLIELLVVIIIVAVFAVIAGSIYTIGSSGEDADYSFFSPEIESARSQRRMADEMQRQNDLMQQRLELLESQNKKPENE